MPLNSRLTAVLAFAFCALHPSAEAGLAGAEKASLADQTVDASDAIRELNIAGGNIGRANSPGCHKNSAVVTERGKKLDQELQSLQRTIQRDKNTIDGMATDLAKTDKSLEPPTATDCEQSVTELRKMYLDIQKHYRDARQNTVLVLDRLKQIGEDYEKLMAEAQLNLKEAKCKPLAEKRKAFFDKFKETYGKVSTLAAAYNSQANSTAARIAEIPAGYCQVGNAATQKPVVNQSKNTATITNTNSNTD